MKFIPNNWTASADCLNGKVILVTGASDGIGKEAAMTYAKHGATVVLLARTESKLDALYDNIITAGYPKPAIVPCDLATTKPEHFNQLANMLQNEFGKLDGLLHNASILGSITPLSYYDTQQWDEVMQVNVNATFYQTKAFLPLLQEAESASIVFTSAGVGRKGRAFWGAYSVSKFATEGLAQILHEELENTSNIRVNTVNPGAIRTSMRAQAFPAESPETLPTAADLMPAYLYLMSDTSCELKGQSLDLKLKS